MTIKTTRQRPFRPDHQEPRSAQSETRRPALRVASLLALTGLALGLTLWSLERQALTSTGVSEAHVALEPPLSFERAEHPEAGEGPDGGEAAGEPLNALRSSATPASVADTVGEEELPLSHELLAAWASDAEVARLRSALAGEPGWELGWAALQHLASLGGDEALAALRSVALAVGDSTLRANALRFYLHSEPTDRLEVLQAVHSGESDARLRACALRLAGGTPSDAATAWLAAQALPCTAREMDGLLAGLADQYRGVPPGPAAVRLRARIEEVAAHASAWPSIADTAAARLRQIDMDPSAYQGCGERF
ncbi:MAG TPA: hypothetical protein QF764_16255 [Planctomycetota bacterium]|nr:hypothetical protein [Planctomycetota bacterium]